MSLRRKVLLFGPHTVTSKLHDLMLKQFITSRIANFFYSTISVAPPPSSPDLIRNASHDREKRCGSETIYLASEDEKIEESIIPL